MAIAPDTFGSSIGFTNTSTPTLTGFAPAAGAAIAVWIANGSNKTVNGVTFNGQALTEVFEGDNSGGVQAGGALYLGVAGPDGSAHDVVVTMSADIGGEAVQITARSWTGVNVTSVAAARRTVYNGGAGSPLTIVDSQAGDMVIHAVHSWGGVLALGQTSVAVSANYAGGSYDSGFHETTASGANTSMTWSGDNGFATTVGVSLIPAAGGSAGKPAYYYAQMGAN